MGFLSICRLMLQDCCLKVSAQIAVYNSLAISPGGPLFVFTKHGFFFFWDAIKMSDSHCLTNLVQWKSQHQHVNSQSSLPCPLFGGHHTCHKSVSLSSSTFLLPTKFAKSLRQDLLINLHMCVCIQKGKLPCSGTCWSVILARTLWCFGLNPNRPHIYIMGNRMHTVCVISGGRIPL